MAGRDSGVRVAVCVTLSQSLDLPGPQFLTFCKVGTSQVSEGLSALGGAARSEPGNLRMLLCRPTYRVP